MVLNMDGDTLRTLSPKLKEGLNKVSWYMDKKGVRGPSRSDRKRDNEPGGVSVLPGTYKLMLMVGDYLDSIMVNVYSDPRVETSVDGLQKLHEANDRFESIVKASKSSFDQLKEAKKTIKLSRELLVNQEDSLKQEMNSFADSLNTQIDSLMNLFSDPEGLKGIQRNPNTLSAMLWPTRGYMRGSLDGPSPNALLQLSKLEAKAEGIIDGVNNFMEGDYRNYESAFNELKINVFKNHDPVKIE